MNHEELGNVQTHILTQNLSRKLHFKLKINNKKIQTNHIILSSWSNFMLSPPIVDELGMKFIKSPNII
jgi:hypothetical protein